MKKKKLKTTTPDSPEYLEAQAEKELQKKYKESEKQKLKLLKELPKENVELVQKVDKFTESMVAAGIPFGLFYAPEEDKTRFWFHYVFLTKEEIEDGDVVSLETQQKIRERAYHLFKGHARTYAKMFGVNIYMTDPNGLVIFRTENGE